MIAGARALGDVLRWHAEQNPDFAILRFFDDQGRELEPLSYRELDRAARSVGALLQAMGATGQPVLLAFELGCAFVEAFFGCAYAGALAVPAHRPRLQTSLQRLEAIVLDCGAKVALCDRESMPRPNVLAAVPALAKLRWTPTNADFGTVWSLWKDPGLDREDICFLQYTSGSTGVPRGVVVSHGNLLHNLASINAAFGLSSSDRGLFWLPPFHDMGLIGAILTPVYVGMPSVLAPPYWFVKKPDRWLRAIARERITVSGAPNFAYQLCVEYKPALEAELDLSCWDVAFVGAEPIRHDTLQKFARAFGSHGFREQAFAPCYGMAESTLLVTSVPRRAGVATANVDRSAYREDRVLAACEAGPETEPLIGCGRPWGEQSVVVVDPATSKLVPDGSVGEIWVRGESVSSGYYGKPELSRELMGAELVADSAMMKPRGPYLRTGDKGFFWEGQLYIAGRLKDMIIVRGRNHYAEDIEHAIASSGPCLRSGDGAAFSIPHDDGERLVAVHEVGPSSDDPELIWQNARRILADSHEITLHELLLIKPRSLPKTTSGKVRRFEARRQYLTGGLRVVQRFGGPSRLEPGGTGNVDAVPEPLRTLERP